MPSNLRTSQLASLFKHSDEVLAAYLNLGPWNYMLAVFGVLQA